MVLRAVWAVWAVKVDLVAGAAEQVVGMAMAAAECIRVVAVWAAKGKAAVQHL